MRNFVELYVVARKLELDEFSTYFDLSDTNVLHQWLYIIFSDFNSQIDESVQSFSEIQQSLEDVLTSDKG